MDNRRTTHWRQDNIPFAAAKMEVAAALLVRLFVFDSMTDLWDGLSSRIHIKSMLRDFNQTTSRHHNDL